VTLDDPVDPTTGERLLPAMPTHPGLTADDLTADVLAGDTLKDLAAPSRSFRQDAWRRFRNNKLAMAGLVIVILLILIGVIGPFFTRNPVPAQERLLSKTPPSGKYWFGLDQLGRDEFARVIHGIRLSLVIGFLVSFLEIFVGLVLGAVAGWYGKWADALIMRLVDVFLALPYFLIAVALVAIAGRGVSAVIITLVVTSWLTTARVVRAAMIQAKELDYVEAARAIGVPARRIVTRHIMPNIIQPILVLLAIGIGSAVLAESALSFLGVGVQEPTASLGLMISKSRDFFAQSPGLLFFPAIAIVFTVLGFLLVGDGIRDALDVKEDV
jgi:ABC-type dipeptide/oligopeptide/nickel transport system permease subunit